MSINPAGLGYFAEGSLYSRIVLFLINYDASSTGIPTCCLRSGVYLNTRYRTGLSNLLVSHHELQ